MESVDRGGIGGRDPCDLISTTLPLSGDGSCIAEARHHAAAFLAHARTERDVTVSARAADLTQLVVSELVTNASKYAPGPLHMDLRIADAMVEVAVQDSLPVRPAARPADPQRIGQHGLEIVMAVAEHFHIHLQPSGKRVTAHIALTDQPTQRTAGTGPSHGPADPSSAGRPHRHAATYEPEIPQSRG